MTRQHIAALFIVASAGLLSAGLAAQDRFTLKTPNGIAFSEFKGYEAWQMIASSQPDDAGGCGSTPAPGCIKKHPRESSDDRGVSRRRSHKRQTRFPTAP